LANWDEQYAEFYVEQVGVVAAALQEALVQDYDGLIRIAPAVPLGWNFDGSVFVQGKTRVNVQTRNGSVTTAVIEAGTTQLYKVRNPWPGQSIEVVSSKDGRKLVKSTQDPVVSFRGEAGHSYILQRQNSPASTQQFEAVSGHPAQAGKKLGQCQIGLFSQDE
jgi:hypothetical protein